MALEAREVLMQDGIGARVVSIPCWELFDQQTVAYRERVLPAGIPRLSVGQASLWDGPDMWA